MNRLTLSSLLFVGLQASVALAEIDFVKEIQPIFKERCYECHGEETREAGLRLIGPNCIGMYVPKAGITLIEGAPEKAGSIGIISQSGGLATDIIRMGGAVGLRFSQAIAIGNSIDLGIEDFLDYMGRDPDRLEL